jgi:hypothetical protein
MYRNSVAAGTQFCHPTTEVIKGALAGEDIL